jgi:Rod binding domain-containing protein
MSAISGPALPQLDAASSLPPPVAVDLHKNDLQKNDLQKNDPRKGEKAAREFEAQLIGMVLESMEKTFASLPGQDEMAGEDNYNYLGTQALASAVADGGGFGIARMISEHLQTRK